jgi:Acetyltransferase (GNAT) domain
MVDYSMKNLEPAVYSDWRKVMEYSDEAGLSHEIETMEYLTRLLRAKNISFILYNSNQEPIGICPLYLYTTATFFGRRCVIDSVGPAGSGPALIRDLGDEPRRKILHFLADAFQDLLIRHGCVVFQTSAEILSKRYTETEIPLVNPLLEMRGFRDVSSPYYYLDLRRTGDELHQHLEKRMKGVLKKYDREWGADALIGPAAPDDFEEAWNLHGTVGENPSLPREMFTEFWGLHCSRFFVARVKGELAGIFCAGVYRNTGVFWLLNIADRYRESGVGAALVWRAILSLKASGVAHFSLGIDQFWELGSKKDRIARFKRSFGGQLRYLFVVQYKSEGRALKMARALLTGD